MNVLLAMSMVAHVCVNPCFILTQWHIKKLLLPLPLLSMSTTIRIIPHMLQYVHTVYMYVAHQPVWL